ncbi:MAG: SRPBCC domain-containing protein [Gammaproteobacteria bacterium]|nr:SRPBCC domain-containing protein [Gammaproteobacteria bacterium]
MVRAPQPFERKRVFDFVVETRPLTIDAPAETVWDILTDGPRYGEWNPFTTRIETDFQAGSPVRAHVVLGRLPVNVTEHTDVAEPPTRLTWSSVYWSQTLLTAAKTQVVTALGPDRCAYRTTDTMAGLLAPIVQALFGRAIRRGFEETAHALKARAEKRYASQVA